MEILGLNGVPDAGDEFVVVSDEKKARDVAEFRKVLDSQQAKQQSSVRGYVCRDWARSEKDSQYHHQGRCSGPLEAIGSLQKLGTDEVEVSVIASGVGGISDGAHLATTSRAMVIGFNTRADKSARVLEDESLKLRYYNVIYDVIDDTKAIMGGMLGRKSGRKLLA